MPTEVLDRASALLTTLRTRPLADQQREKAAVWRIAEEVFAGSVGQGRSMDAAETARYDELTGFIEDVNQREQAERRHREVQARMGEPQRDQRVMGGGDGELEQREEYRQAALAWLRGGTAELDPEQRAIMRRGWRQARTPDETRAMGTTTGAAGGYAVPTNLGVGVIQTLKDFTPLTPYCDFQETDDGSDWDFVTNDDTANTGIEVGESADVGAATDPALGLVTIRSYLYTSKVLKVPFTLLQDASFDIETWIAERLGERLGRIFALRQASGDGVNKIQGITVGGAVGKTFASATAITYNEMMDLEHSVDPAYRKAGRARYIFGDPSLLAVRKLADSQNRPLWVPWLGQGIAGAVPSTINGWDYVIANDMPTMATTNRSFAFGDFKAGYRYRQVRGMRLQRLEERYAEFGQVGFLLFARADARVIDTGAFKLGAQA